MAQPNVIDIGLFRKKEKKREKKDRLNFGKKGSVFGRNGKIWVDFRYLKRRVREPSGLKDTTENRHVVRKQLDLIMAEIDNGVFEFAKRFPNSSKKDLFTILEGAIVTRKPSEITFGEYLKKWWIDMEPGMSENQIRDYKVPLNKHILPFFKEIPFSEFKPVLMKKFVGDLKSKRNRYGKPYSPKTIRNYLTPLRVILRDAVDEYGWEDMRNPFWGLKLPKNRRRRIQPFNFNEWGIFLAHILPWYRPYFEFAVQTGLRPSEQVALKWSAISDDAIHVELSRVRNQEKTEMKTVGSDRTIELRPVIRNTIEVQRKLTAHFNSPYVFVNSEARPIQQENLGKIWHRGLQKAGLPPRRMYETRHTFASWALAAGEPAEWVAKILGHVDTTMVFRTYSRYIPNLTRMDGTAFEAQYTQNILKQGDHFGHNRGHNRQNPGHPA